MLKEKIEKTNQANDLKIAIKIIRVELYKKKKEKNVGGWDKISLKKNIKIKRMMTKFNINTN